MKKFSKLLAMMCAVVVMITAIGTFAPAMEVKAAVAPKLSTTSVVTPLGKATSWGSWYHYLKNGESQSKQVKELTVKNKVKGATYTFTSSNTKVAKISKKGGYVEGLKPGTATITCKQTYKGKTKTIGKCKVTVKAPKCFSQEENNTPVGLIPSGYLVNDQLQYEPFEGNYYFTCKSNDENVVISEDMQTAQIKKAGTYIIDVYLQYKKQSIKIGTTKIVANDAKPCDYTVDSAMKGDEFDAFLLLDWGNENDAYTFTVVSGEDVLKPTEDESGRYFEIIGEGSASVEIFRDGTSLGTQTLTVGSFMEEMPEDW